MVDTRHEQAVTFLEDYCPGIVDPTHKRHGIAHVDIDDVRRAEALLLMLGCEKLGGGNAASFMYGDKIIAQTHTSKSIGLSIYTYNFSIYILNQG